MTSRQAMSTRRYHPSPLIDSAGGRGLAIYRFLALAYAVLVVVLHREHVVQWWPVLAYLTTLLGWSFVAPLLRRPSAVAVVAELGLAVLGIFLTSVVYEPDQVAAGIQTVPGIWAASPVFAGALLAGMRGGVPAAAVVATANLAQTQQWSALMWHNIVLLFLLGSLVGLAVQLARQSQVRLEAALAASERLAERERIGRQVHDGVLQALALINRQGREMGGEGRRLAELAAEQERSLRSLITRFEPASGGTVRPEPGSQSTDLAGLLTLRRGAQVEVALPAGPVLLPTPVAHEVDAAVAAALDNVVRHAGEGARAWVLVDVDDEQVAVVIRDDGVGLAQDRLVEAAGEGRLGASSSIRGRMRDLGGDASWRAPGTGGCTVTLTLPLAEVAGSTP